jgi:mRNA-degrading endonuclease RelE of RelBE toxin-antitoxin system
VELVISPRALRQLKGIPKADAHRLIAAMKEVAALDPQRIAYVTEMVGQPGVWRARKGNFRALFTITETTVVVEAVGNRKDVYE